MVNDCPICSNLCLTSGDSWCEFITPTRLISSLSLHSPYQSLPPRWCILNSNVPSFLYSTNFIFTWSFFTMQIIRPPQSHTQHWSLPFLKVRIVYIRTCTDLSVILPFSFDVTHSLFLYFLSATNVCHFFHKTAPPIYYSHFHHSAFPFVCG